MIKSVGTFILIGTLFLSVAARSATCEEAMGLPQGALKPVKALALFIDYSAHKLAGGRDKMADRAFQFEDADTLPNARSTVMSDVQGALEILTHLQSAQVTAAKMELIRQQALVWKEKVALSLDEDAPWPGYGLDGATPPELKGFTDLIIRCWIGYANNKEISVLSPDEASYRYEMAARGASEKYAVGRTLQLTLELLALLKENSISSSNAGEIFRHGNILYHVMNRTRSDFTGNWPNF